MNRWLAHVKQVQKVNPSKRLKDILKMAGKTYKKTKAIVIKPTKKSRKSRKSRKTRKSRK